MILMKRLNSKQVLEILSDIARDSLPPEKEGKLHLRYDEDDGVEIFFLEKNDQIAQTSN